MEGENIFSPAQKQLQQMVIPVLGLVNGQPHFLLPLKKKKKI